MALIKCKECGEQISDKAQSCPKCGAKPKKKTSVFVWIVGGIFGLIVFSMVMSDKPSTTRKTASPTAAPVVATPPTKIAGSQWSYNSFEDKMSGEDTLQAVVSSSNTVNFGSPYSGAQHGTLILRTHPRHGKDLIFMIKKGQILCTSYQDCDILIKFDDQKAELYKAVSPDDNSTESIFIRDYSRFAGQMMRSKKVNISMSIYHEGSPVFEFDVSDFSRDKYLPE